MSVSTVLKERESFLLNLQHLIAAYVFTEVVMLPLGYLLFLGQRLPLLSLLGLHHSWHR